MSTRWRAGLSVLGIIVVLGICGLGSWFIVVDEQKGVQAQANVNTPRPTSTPIDITSRTVDPEPLTVDEVFPSRTILIDPDRPNELYTMIGSPQALIECNPAADGAIKELILGYGCSQVVRATLSTPAEGYVVTAGIINLDTAANAEKAWEEIKAIVTEQRGRFVGYVINSDRNTRSLALASSVAGWTVRGHYVAYCVIARTDSKEIPDADPYAQQIMTDMVQLYLKDRILEDRANDPILDPSAEPTPETSASPGP